MPASGGARGVMFWTGRRPGDAVPTRRRVLSLPGLLSLALAGAFLVFLVARFDVDLGATWERAKGSSPWYLAPAFLVHYTTFICRGTRWRLLLRNIQGQGSPVPGVLYCSQLVLLGWFANAVAWLRLGDAYRAYLYADEQDTFFSRTIGTILAERTLDAILVALLLVAAAPFLVKGGGGAAWPVLAIAVVLVGLLAALLVAMTWAGQWASAKLPGWLAERYRRFHQGTLGSFRRVLPVTLWGLLGWLAEVGRFYLVTRALGLDIGFAPVIFLTLANSLLTLVPTPGGFGAVESGVAGLAVRLAQLSSSGAAALVLVDRAITYLSIVVMGALLFVGRQALHRRQGPRRPVSLEEAESQ